MTWWEHLVAWHRRQQLIVATFGEPTTPHLTRDEQVGAAEIASAPPSPPPAPVRAL